VNFFEALVKYVEFLVQEVGKGLIWTIPIFPYANTLFFFYLQKQDHWAFANEISSVLFELTQISGDDIASFMIASLNEKCELYNQNKSEVQGTTVSVCNVDYYSHEFVATK
jgi:hypothetical protein